MDFIYELKFKVRDYECDLQGIVNNANYQHYLEHTRHEFLLTHKISFADLHRQGIDFVVARVNISYKHPLTSADSFISRLALVREGVRYVFYQNIYRLPDEKLCVRAKVDCVATKNSQLSRCEFLDQFIDDIIRK